MGVYINMGRKILDILQTEIEAPLPYGVFHFSWCFVAIGLIILLFTIRNKHNEKRLKWILGIYAIPTLILEALKQLIWSVEYNVESSGFVWDFQWYAFPFQLCTTPLYICLIALFLKKCKLRDYLLSFMGYITILGSIATVVRPHDVFVSDLLIDIHTMYLHAGSLVVSVYLLMSREVEINLKGFFRAVVTFIAFCAIANIMNIAVYNSGILNGETFNMFYISPYFESSLPVFDVIYNAVPYLVFLAIYVVALSLGGFIILGLAYMIDNLITKRKLKKA